MGLSVRWQTEEALYFQEEPPADVLRILMDLFGETPPVLRWSGEPLLRLVTYAPVAVVKAVAKGNDLLSGIPQAVGLGQHGDGLVHAGLRDADHLMALVHEAQPRRGAAQGFHLFRGCWAAPGWALPWEMPTR